MELHTYARRVLLSDDLAVKLAAPAEPLTDAEPGWPLRPELPGRPANLKIAPRREAPALPKPGGFVDPRRRGVAHHLLANHELQAAEVMAAVLLAFPEAPAEFRMGLAGILADEQRHTRMHVRRCGELGVPFGSLPVSGYIWEKARAFTGVLDYLAGVPLTLEHRNLDHSLALEQNFAAAGDEKGAATMRAIHRDEIRHVAFGLDWLRRLKPPGQTDFDAYAAHLHWPLRPEKAVAVPYDRAGRVAAGMDEEFLTRLEAAVAGEEFGNRAR